MTRADVPQADSLPRVRQLVEAAKRWPPLSLRELGAKIGLSERHADYYGRAAVRTLGLLMLDETRVKLTVRGRDLLRTERGSASERDLFGECIRGSEDLASLGFDLLGSDAPSRGTLEAAVVRAGFSPATAKRRVTTLLSWRAYVRDPQLPLDPSIVPRKRDVVRRRHVKTSFIHVTRFGPVGTAKIELGDFTVLVGPQATGKSLILQLWKLAVDRAYLLPYLRHAGVSIADPDAMLDVYFGDGMHSAWGPPTRVETSEGNLRKRDLSSHKGHKPREHERVFYVPAHRGLLLANGWPLRFQQLPDVPVVARLFSERLNLALSSADHQLFPLGRKLKSELRKVLDEAVFHGAQVVLQERARQRQMRLTYGENVDLGYMTWTAGQREFVPLLLGLYELLPSGTKPKHDTVDWVIVEEPEMGLHPLAVRAVMLLLFELAHRGYKVIVSTHSPLVLDVLWGLQRIRESLPDPKDAVPLVRKMFGASGGAGVNAIAESALQKRVRAYALRPRVEDGLAESVDISRLEPDSDDSVVAGWGGLTGLSSEIAVLVGEAMRRAEAGR